MRPPAAPAPESWPPAAVLPHLFVARNVVPGEVARRRLGDDLDELVDLGLAERDAGAVRARVALLPLGESLVVCGPPPDDSSFHLIGALPRRRLAAWLDVGTGNAIAPLARRDLAASILATDVDGHALAFAELGALLSDACSLTLGRADLLAGASAHAPWPLITFNAPIPTDDGALLDRFWLEVRDVVAPDGEVILHSQQPLDDYPARLGLPGSTVAVRYTPAAVSPAFGVTIWRPSDGERCELHPARLSAQRPHVARDYFGLDD
jgi:hypothetical protein